MSLSIIQNPLYIMPVNNPIPIVASSTNSSDVGFRYYITFGITGTSTTSLSFFIYPDTQNYNYMIYDSSQILSDYIGSDLFWNTGLTIHDKDIVKYNYSIIEYIGSTSGDTYTNSNTYRAFRGVKQYGDYWEPSQYMMDTNSPGEFLTNWKDNRYYKDTEYSILKAFNGNLTYGTWTTGSSGSTGEWEYTGSSEFSSMTQIKINNTDKNSTDFSSIISNLTIGNSLYLEKAIDTTIYGSYIITGVITGSTYTFDVSTISSSGSTAGGIDINIYLNTQAESWDRALITTYRGDTTAQYAFYPSGDPNTKYTGTELSIFTIPYGPANLNLCGTGGMIYTSGTGGTWTIENDNIIKSNTDKYSITLQTSGSSWIDSSETLWTYIDRNCYKHTGVEFIWLNDLGGYDSYTFREADIKSYKIDRDETRKNYYGFKSGSYTYNIGDRGRQINYIKTTEQRQSLSVYLNTETSQNLMELYRSPEAYLILNDDIYPIIITNTIIEEKTIRNNRLFNHRIDFEMAYEKLSNI